MKRLVLIFALYTSLTSAQSSYSFIYGFTLDEKINTKSITATVYYKDTPLVTEVKMKGGKLQKIKNDFLYLEKTTTVDGLKKVAYNLPKNTFYWWLTDAMNTALTAHPERFKVKIQSKNSQINRTYQLPQTFDLVAENTIRLDVKKKSKQQFEKEFKQKIWRLTLPKKEAIQTKKQSEKDTLLVYSSREKIPDGLLLRFPEIKTTQFFSLQEFTSQGMMVQNKLFLKMEEKMTTNPDQSKGIYVDFDGNLCATSGGILGTGSGACAGAGTTKQRTLYRITIQIEP